MYVYSIFLALLLRGAGGNRTTVVRPGNVIYDEVNDRPGRCLEATSLEEVLGCPFRGKTYAYNDREIVDQVEYLCTYSREACKVTMVPMHCMLGATRVDGGAGFAMGKLFYMCSLHENNTGIKAIGCASEDGMRIQIGQKYRYGNLVFYCQMRQGNMEAVFIGCGQGNGLIRPGETYKVGTAIVKCEEKTKRPPNLKQNEGRKDVRNASDPSHGNQSKGGHTNDRPNVVGNGPLQSEVVGRNNWFCMDSNISALCEFTVSGKKYSLGVGYGQWIDKNMFFCDRTVYEGAKLCFNF